MKAYVAQFVFSALHELYRKQPDLSRFVPQETDEREPNLSFHFANELWRYLFWLDCDFDVIKRPHANKRPDIIFHKRGFGHLNFLVCEVKRESNRDRDDGIEGDVEKIKQHWFRGNLHYRFGASVVIDENRHRFGVRLLSRDGQAESTFSQDDRQLLIAVPRSAPARRGAFIRLAQRFCKSNTATDRVALQQKLDARITAFYG